MRAGNQKGETMKARHLGTTALLALAAAAQTSAEPTRAAAPAQRAPVATNAVQEGDVPYKADLIGRQKNLRAATRALEQKITLYDLPLLANDLAAGRRNYVGKTIHSSSGSQMWGYDIGAMQWNADQNTWSEVKPGTDWNAPKNSDYYIYGQPIYAAGPGKVIRCWRNAPENPRPYSSALGDSFDEAFEDRDWLHAQWRAKRMSGGGNHLLVEEANGDLVLYAHAQPGSISASLCPHNSQLYSVADADAEADVPDAQQATISAGQFLYKAGNSGNSSAPHLHIHKQDPDGEPLQFRFRRGLSTAVTNGNKADINKWTSFSGKPIPSGPILFWPPSKLGGEYARHGYEAGDFQRLFDHLANSGFWPEWIDGYSVNGKPYLNFVWRPAAAEWRSFFLIDGASYQAEVTKAKTDGFSPVQVESSLSGGQVRYTVIFAKGVPGQWEARHGLTTAQHEALLDQMKAAGLSPINVSVVAPGGDRRYTVLYRKRDIGAWQVKSRVAEADYQALYSANAAEGRRPYYVNAYMDDGKPYISVIFSSKPPGARKDRHSLTAAGYQQEFDSAMSAGLATRAVSAFDGAQSQHRFIAIWRK